METKVTRKAIIHELNSYRWSYSVIDESHADGAKAVLAKGISKATIKAVVKYYYPSLRDGMEERNAGEYNLTNCAAYLADFCGWAQARRYNIFLGDTVWFHKA